MEPDRRRLPLDPAERVVSIEIRPARTPKDLEACFPVLRELRPHLASAAELLSRVERQSDDGYRLLAAWRDDEVVGAAGYRMQENLIRGRFCYVDDLVVAEAGRRGGLGARLLDAVADEARAGGSHWLVLDTSLDNLLGQRFYFRYGMLPGALRFAKALD
jgi:GNAT superfamily N-acetyltransferase